MTHVSTLTELFQHSRQEVIAKAYENPSTTNVAEDSWSFLPPIKTQQAKISRRRQVKGFVEHVICKGPRGLIEEFRKMKRTNDLTKMTEFVAQIHTGKNRYKDVGCLDNNRVILTIGPCSYIHANYVSTPDNPKKFICTQAPLPGTCAEFWCMVVQESAEVIVMLCNFIEQKSKKCAVYFPTQRNAPMMFNDVEVCFKSQEQYTFPFETKSKLEITFLEVKIPGFSPHTCSHYHWKDWPDRGVPPADLAPLHLLDSFKNTKTPIIIHCSAGIGRTGSMVLLEHAIEVLQKGGTLEEMSVYLLELRKQRNNSIQVGFRYVLADW
ncbi:Protein-tyrosine phosphatase [Ancylostoma caninum]|uniref:Protein-tyrosine phosphatase n=1 Tax=Ancylostoma caninum TaxID=29170 RepID=A0A368GAR3_ANCCA|nr:Protein-tyrosine phosphatase [Ancylostoma caninum]